MAPSKSQTKGALSALSALDAFPKVNEDFYHKTASGGVITVVAYAFMLLLFLTETRLYLAVQRTHELQVDSTIGATISIDVDVTFPRMPCAWLSLDAMDVSGELHLDVEHDVYKQRLSQGGTPVSEAERHLLSASAALNGANSSGSGDNGTAAACGNCYGAEDEAHPCCSTCDDVRDAYQRKGWMMLKLTDVTQCADTQYFDSIKTQEGEGCRMWGRLHVNKVAGNFHFAAGRSYQQGSVHVHDISPFNGKTLDFTHDIKKLSFGPQYPGMKNPLEGVSSAAPGGLGEAALAAAANKKGRAAAAGEGKEKETQTKGSKVAVAAPPGMYQYFLKVVPTVYVDPSNKTLVSNQYSVTEHFRESTPTPANAVAPTGNNARTLPGVFFFYDLSPIKVHIAESRSSFLHYLTNLCAIVGGIFAVSGLLDGAVHQGERIIRTKMQMGKFS